MRVGGWTVRLQCRGTWRTAASLFALSLIAPLAIGGGAAAQGTVSVSGSPGTLRIRNAVAGGTLTPVTDATTTYNVTTPNSGAGYHMTAQLNNAMPSGVTLKVTCAAPSGGVSAGAVTLSTTAANVVTSIDKKTTASGLSITYTLSATLAAGVVTSQSRTVTFTIVNGP